MRRRAAERAGDKLKTRALQHLETQLTSLCRCAPMESPESLDRRCPSLPPLNSRLHVRANVYLNTCARHLFSGAQQVRRRGFIDVLLTAVGADVGGTPLITRTVELRFTVT